VKIGKPEETEPPTYEVEEVGKRNSGDRTFQAILSIKGQNDRIRQVRAPTRTSEEQAAGDGEEMKKAFMEGGMQGVRDWQQTRRRGSIH